LGLYKIVSKKIKKYYQEENLNCAVTSLKILSEHFDLELSSQVTDAAVGMNGAGRYQAQCGLVEGVLMFIGVFGRNRNISDDHIVKLCNKFAERFELEFSSLSCKKLRPNGFNPEDPPHMCEELTRETVSFSIKFIEENVKSGTNSFIQKTFTKKVSKTYEYINHILTFGLDIIWRKKAAGIAAASGGDRWVDMCTGTGETACYLSRLASDRTKIYAVDISKPMMAVAMKKPEAVNIEFVVSDVKTLPFPDNYFDLITISFATRNINLSKEILIKTFTEFNRVLKPGGRFVNLETSQPSSLLIRFFFHLYIKLLVKFVGELISGSRQGYSYLSNTIPRFYPAEELKDILSTAGFKTVEYKKLLLGIAAIHQGVK